jgi:hypothetical protein
MSEITVKALSIPNTQPKFQEELSRVYLKWLKSKFSNIGEVIINLDEFFSNFEKSLKDFNYKHVFANLRVRL